MSNQNNINNYTPVTHKYDKFVHTNGVAYAFLETPVSILDEEIPEVANEELQKLGLIKKGESFVVTGGVPVGISGTTNYLTVLTGS